MPAATAASDIDLETLSAIERRVLWLAVRIVDYANRERAKGDELKVGGHQASSASMVTLMTALYLADLRAEDPADTEEQPGLPVDLGELRVTGERRQTHEKYRREGCPDRALRRVAQRDEEGHHDEPAP